MMKRSTRKKMPETGSSTSDFEHEDSEATTSKSSDSVFSDESKDNVRLKKAKKEQVSRKISKKHIKKKNDKVGQKLNKGKKEKDDLGWNDFWGFKCHFPDVVEFSSNAMKRFDNYSWKVMKATPFYHFYYSIHEGLLTKEKVMKCCKHIYHILTLYSKEEKGFRLNQNRDEVARLSTKLTFAVFGIRVGPCNFDGSDKNLVDDVDFYEKFFINKKCVTRKEVKEVFDRINCKDELTNEDRVDIVKLIILYSFSGIFFACTSGYVARGLIKHFNSIKKLNEVCWPKQITSDLREKVEKYSSQIKSVQGCVYLIMYMLLEHTEIFEEVEGLEEKFPRMIKWDLSKIKSIKWDVLKQRLNSSEVKTALSDLNDMEKELIGDFVDDEQVMIISKESRKEKIKVQKSSGNPLKDLCQAAFQNEGETESKKSVDELEKKKGKKKLVVKDDVPPSESKDAMDFSAENICEVRTDKTGQMDKGDSSQHDTMHMMYLIPNDEVNSIIEQYYKDDKFLKNVEDDAEKLKYLLRREKSIREKMYLRGMYLEKILSIRENKGNKDESNCLVEEMDLMRETYSQALDLYETESLRVDLSMQSIIRSDQKTIEWQKNHIEYLNNEVEEQKDVIVGMEKSIAQQRKTITECRKREKSLLNEVTELKRKFDDHEKETLGKQFILEEKIMDLEKKREKRSCGEDIDKGRREEGDLSDKLKSLAEENEELIKKASETIELQRKMEEDSRMIEKLKNTCAKLAGQNKDMVNEIADLRRIIDDQGGYPIMAIPLKSVAEVNDEGGSEKSPKVSKLSDLKTRGQRKREADNPIDLKDHIQKKARVYKRKDQKKDLTVDVKKPNVQRRKTISENVGNGNLSDPSTSKYWGKLSKELQEKLNDICKDLNESNLVWLSQHPSVIDTVTISAKSLEDIYMNRVLSAEVMDWVLIVSHKDYSSSSSQEMRTISLRAGDYDHVKKGDTRKQGFDSIKKVLEAKLFGGERYVLVPMMSSENHWTLLYLDVANLEWHHYNSLVGDKDRLLIDFKKAEKYRKLIEGYLKPILTRTLNIDEAVFKSVIIKHEEPKQRNQYDSGVYVCLYAFRLMVNKPTEFNAEEAETVRAIWTSDILSNPSFGYDKEKPFVPVEY